MSNFQPLEVVSRGSETQPQVVENLTKLAWRDKGYYIIMSSITSDTVSLLCTLSGHGGIQYFTKTRQVWYARIIHW